MARHRGRGLAAIVHPIGMNQGGDPSQAWMKVKPDGRVDVFTGTVDTGQGSKTVHAQIAADTLGVPYDWVTVDNSSTGSSPLCTGSFESRSTLAGGNAVAVAARDARAKLLEIAARELEVDVSELELAEGEVRVAGAPDRTLGVAEVAAAATWTYGELIAGAGAWMKPYSAADPDSGECEPFAAVSYGACVADVEVDDETGEVRVLKLTQAYDVGRAINPLLVEGELDGGAVLGLGAALLEASYPHYPSHGHRGDQFGSYLAPSAQDLPELEHVVLENPAADGPFGARGVSGIANTAQPAAICSAIHDALGVWVTESPATPERVLRALEARRQPRRDGKRLIFDEELSVQAVSGTGGAGFIGL
ncbi:MAG: xanthine dehydrogenase family protein molybdopterin-binding subunit [Gaiellaceae bacterium]